MLDASPLETSRCVSGVALDLKSSAEDIDLCLLVVDDVVSCRGCGFISPCLLLRSDMSVPLAECPCL